MIDLHTHTTASDGTYSPQQLIDYAIAKKLKALAITDHDTIDGLLEAQAYMSEKGISKDTLELINGIELSTTMDRYDFDIHIVGLFINIKHQSFIHGLKRIYDDRERRNEKMIASLQAHDYDITSAKLKAHAKDSVITRSHFASYLVQKGYFEKTKDVFHTLIGNGKKFYVPREDVSSQSAIELIKKSGGIPVLAHPTLYPLDSNGLYSLVDQLKSYGLEAIETYYSLYSSQETRAMLHIAKRFSLLRSGGSDFHGANKPGNDLGTGFGHLCVPDELLIAMHQHL
ncbi:PHP domain-containing protein [Vallitaleaceae bacterium 9-2]